MKTERTFAVFTKIIANWDEIDSFIKDVIAIDTGNFVNSISISLSDVKNGMLDDNFMPIISVTNYKENDLIEEISFRNMPSVIRPDMLPDDAIILWERK